MKITADQAATALTKLPPDLHRLFHWLITGKHATAPALNGGK